MRIRLAAIALAALAFTGAAGAQMAKGRLEGDVKQLCDLICGAWEPSDPPAPDAIFTTYRYEWDEALGLIVGRAVSVGGIGGFHFESVIYFGEGPSKDELWTMTARSERAPLYGTVSVSDDGYIVTTAPLHGGDSKMITRCSFSGRDDFTCEYEVLVRGKWMKDLPASWRRKDG